MGRLDSSLTWQRSSYTGTNGGNCVETAAQAGRLLVRDSKDHGGTVLNFSPQAWQQFTASLKADLCHVVRVGSQLSEASSVL